jgi:hypothetical protein
MLTAVLLAISFLCVGLVAQYVISFSMGGQAIQKSVNRTGNHQNSYQVSIPIAWAVSSWVKTSGTVAAGNLTAGHGQTTGTYDVFWASGGGGRR